ncbi:cyclin-H isoform X2 [Tetranychus urticae]|uniref:cyclin-H isoform X2 n=1 Tax=Tetranychus urticae TaxID=32264 RepID=UPI00077BA1E3|nr:cyclin-H isoform X2 [Tetranychus urticae]XP_015782722.1 cyclin-H isoform X2 [Tetranychus urticae]
MFATSSQRKCWIFEDEKELDTLREEANARFIEAHKKDTPRKYFLSPIEEKTLLRQYNIVLRDFCRKFQPSMPKTVVGTAFQFYKRFYVNNSVMDYHPKHIVVTCVYLACKVEEFNVSMDQFVANVKGDRAKAADIILNNELLLMAQLKYHLTVHNPFRPIEGLLIDIKARFMNPGDVEKLRPQIDVFMNTVFFTDACLLFSPSQIALASILDSASKCNIDLSSYLTDLLFSNAPEKLDQFYHMKENLKLMIENIEQVSKDQIKLIEKKLEKCRNQSNNPDSAEYRSGLEESLDNDVTAPMAKYAKISEKQRKYDDNIMQI